MAKGRKMQDERNESIRSKRKINELAYDKSAKIAKILNIHQTWPNSILKVSRIPRRLVLYIIGNVTRYIMVSVLYSLQTNLLVVVTFE